MRLFIDHGTEDGNIFQLARSDLSIVRYRKLDLEFDRRRGSLSMNNGRTFTSRCELARLSVYIRAIHANQLTLGT